MSMPKKPLGNLFKYDIVSEESQEEGPDSEMTQESLYSTSSSTTLTERAVSRQDRAFKECCRKSFNAGKKANMLEEQDSIIDQIESSDESVKPSSVMLEGTKEAWRTSADSAWLLIRLGGLCETWGVVISWWCNSFAEHVKLSATADEDASFWKMITGYSTNIHPNFNRVTRIDFSRTPTRQLRLEMRGGHHDFQMKRFCIGIRQVEVLGCRASIFESWQPAQRYLIEEKPRKLDHRTSRKELAYLNKDDYKKLYMPGEALKEAQALCKEGQIPTWGLVIQSGILDQRQVWPGTKHRSRNQIPSIDRWTEKDPSHPFYWKSPRERRQLQHMQEQSMVETEQKDDFYEEWGNQPGIQSKSGASPGSTRPASAQSRPLSAFGAWRRPSTPLKYSSSPASTRPTTAGTSRGGTRPSTPGHYGSPSGARSRPASSNSYASRFGDSRPSTAGPSRPSSSDAYASRFGSRPSTAGPSRSGVHASRRESRPSTAGPSRSGVARKKRPGSAPQERIGESEEEWHEFIREEEVVH